MKVDTGAENQQEQFSALMKAGSQALAAGDRQTAHERWRAAAIIDPYNEKVWLALLRVLDTDEDRRVCLENIIAINPMNVQARRQLRQHVPSTTPVPTALEMADPSTEPKRPPARPAKKTTSRMRAGKRKPQFSAARMILFAVGAVVIGLVIVLLLSVVLFGR